MEEVVVVCGDLSMGSVCVVGECVNVRGGGLGCGMGMEQCQLVEWHVVWSWDGRRCGGMGIVGRSDDVVSDLCMRNVDVVWECVTVWSGGLVC